MSRGYTVYGPDAGGAAPQTAVAIIASTTVRPRLFDVVFGSAATPADQSATIAISLFTAAGTAGSSPTPQKTDPADVAAIATCGITHSAEPTYAATFLWQMPLNLRASFRQAFNPGFELIAPATAANGIGVKRHASSASYAVTATASWYE